MMIMMMMTAANLQHQRSALGWDRRTDGQTRGSFVDPAPRYSAGSANNRAALLRKSFGTHCNHGRRKKAKHQLETANSTYHVTWPLLACHRAVVGVVYTSCEPVSSLRSVSVFRSGNNEQRDTVQ